MGQSSLRVSPHFAKQGTFLSKELRLGLLLPAAKIDLVPIWPSCISTIPQ